MDWFKGSSDQSCLCKGLKVLLIDDDVKLHLLFKDYLAGFGGELISHLSGQNVEEQVSKIAPDLVLLDIMLPEISGFDLLASLKSSYQRLPVIIISARDDVFDRVFGLESGADDYLAKPFSPRELMARIKAVLRRSVLMEPGAYLPKGYLVNGELSLDLAKMTLDRQGQSANLTVAEFNVLKLLMERPGRVYSREEIIEAVFGQKYSVSPRNIDVHIRRLRIILEQIGAENLIKTLRGGGYCWVGGV
jgi:DNA-binding response OmpR family regulator